MPLWGRGVTVVYIVLQHVFQSGPRSCAARAQWQQARVQTHRVTETDSLNFSVKKASTDAQVYNSIAVIFISQQLHKCAQ